MVPDHLCVPGLDRPVTVSEYAKLKGVREADVLAFIHELKIRSAYFRGQWWVEAPRNCEARLAQLRGDHPPDSRQNPHTPNEDARVLNSPRATVKTKEETPPNSEVERLRVQFVKSDWRYNRLTPAQQEALLKTTKYAVRPEPIDYGLSRNDICLHHGRYLLLNDDLKYREDGPLHGWGRILLITFVLYICAFGAGVYLHNSGRLQGTTSELWKLAVVAVPVSLIGSFYLFAISEGLVDAYQRRRSEAGYLRYKEDIGLHELYQSTAQKAVHEAETGDSAEEALILGIPRWLCL